MYICNLKTLLVTAGDLSTYSIDAQLPEHVASIMVKFTEYARHYEEEIFITLFFSFYFVHTLGQYFDYFSSGFV